MSAVSHYPITERLNQALRFSHLQRLLNVTFDPVTSMYLLNVTLHKCITDILYSDILNEIRTAIKGNIHEIKYDWNNGDETVIVLVLNRKHTDLFELVTKLKEFISDVESDGMRFRSHAWVSFTQPTDNELPPTHESTIMSRLVESYMYLTDNIHDNHCQLFFPRLVEGTTVIDIGSQKQFILKTYTDCGTPLTILRNVDKEHEMEKYKLPSVSLYQSKIMLHTDTYGEYLLSDGEVNRIIHTLGDYTNSEEILARICKLFCDYYLSYSEGRTRHEGSIIRGESHRHHGG